MDILNKINWKVRFMNRTWVLAFTAALFVLAGAVLKTFGVHVDMTNFQENITDVIYAVFGVLAVIGVVMDGTTPNFEDSQKALEYDVPGKFTGKADDIEVDE